jgi:hypothetical protein
MENTPHPSPLRSTGEGTDEFDTIADELYALRPDEFAAARDERVRKARAEGQSALARELGRLRRPTQSAWLINLLWRDQREVMEQLFVLAEELTRAQAEAAGAELRELTAQRRQVESALIRQARVLAQQAGVSVSMSMEREAQETLAAALANPDVATEVRTGRLVKPASYAGFGGGVSPAPVVRAPAPEPPAKKEAAREPIDIRDAEQARARRQAEEQASERVRQLREDAEREVHDARIALEAAIADVTERASAAEAAQQQLGEARARVEELQQQLREAEQHVATADRAARETMQRHNQAETARAAAQRTLDRAQQRLKDVTAEP